MSWASLTTRTRQAAHRCLGGVSVTAGAVSGMGILDHNAQFVGEDGILGSVEYQLSNLPTALFGGLEYGDAVTVDGQPYEVRQGAMPIGDGTDCFVLLTRLAVALSKFLLEDGSALLLEDGSFLLLED